jgi:CO/xanthine dehydrogenase Mo-binding subunit
MCSCVNVISVDDVGKAINPQLVEGQIEGAVVQAAGLFVDGRLEEKGCQNFNGQAFKVSDSDGKRYPVKTRSVIMELADPIGPYGARGVGEMPYLPFAPGVLEAVYQATGVRFNRFPLTDETVLRGLGKLPAHEVGCWDYE